MAPQNIEDLSWWALNLAIFGLLWFIRKDLKGMREDLKQRQRVDNWLRHAVLTWYTRCSMMHPQHPMPPLDEDPDSNSGG